MDIAICEGLLTPYDKLIMDPVHGGIPLYRHEVQVIDHPLFQRLRNICQNDILSLVFPGATHSRFLHSIGVMHVGGRMFRALVDSYLKEKYVYGKDGVTGKQLEAIFYFSKIVRLACLLHDCGHSSFSHQFSKTATLMELMSAPDLFTRLWRGEPWQTYYDNEPRHLEHEHFSVRCAHEILKTVNVALYGIDMRDVIGLMETGSGIMSQQFCDHATEFWRFITHDRYDNSPLKVSFLIRHLLKSIVSGEFDADRADYMLRDSFHSSVTIGGFSLDHLLSNLRIGWNLEQPWFGLAISEKGLGALEDFVFSRHQMYRQVYGHKTALGFDWLLREAINEVLQQTEIRSFVDSCLRNISNFTELTDSFFWESFRRYAKQQPKSYSNCIVNRVKLRHIDTKTNLDAEQIEQLRQRYADQLAMPKNQIVTCTMHARFSRIGTNFDAMKVLTKAPVSKKHQLKNIVELSNFFDKFADESIVHFYIDPLI